VGAARHLHDAVVARVHGASKPDGHTRVRDLTHLELERAADLVVSVVFLEHIVERSPALRGLRAALDPAAMRSYLLPPGGSAGAAQGTRSTSSMPGPRTSTPQARRAQTLANDEVAPIQTGR
jgi:hypothetical protein